MEFEITEEEEVQVETLSRVIGGYFASWWCRTLNLIPELSGWVIVPNLQFQAIGKYGVPHFSDEEIEKYLVQI